eukprot:COSAG03_NODE_7989_length_848_cov_1.284379_2_plen_161_part_00
MSQAAHLQAHTVSASTKRERGGGREGGRERGREGERDRQTGRQTDRLTAQARERFDVDVAVVQRVHKFVDDLEMDEPVSEVEVRAYRPRSLREKGQRERQREKERERQRQRERDRSRDRGNRGDRDRERGHRERSESPPSKRASERCCQRSRTPKGCTEA